MKQIHMTRQGYINVAQVCVVLAKILRVFIIPGDRLFNFVMRIGDNAVARAKELPVPTRRISFKKSWYKRLLDRIPRRAYYVCLDGVRGYIVFSPNDPLVVDERQLSIEEDGKDLITLKATRISPARLETLEEFTGW